VHGINTETISSMCQDTEWIIYDRIGRCLWLKYSRSPLLRAGRLGCWRSIGRLSPYFSLDRGVVWRRCAVLLRWLLYCECSRYFFPRRDECAASNSSSISAAGNETATEERIMIMVMMMIPPAHSYH
jgi:hypothetical protein